MKTFALKVLTGVLLFSAAMAADINSGSVILVAKRSLRDRVYGQTVLMVKPLGENRHTGFMVNKPTNLTLGKLFRDHRPSQKITDPIYLGGPTGPEIIFALVRDSQRPTGKVLHVQDDLYLAYDAPMIDRIIESQPLPSRARFFAGMVMWQPGELAEEIKRGLWHVLDLQPRYIFPTGSIDKLWEDLVNLSERKDSTI